MLVSSLSHGEWVCSGQFSSGLSVWYWFFPWFYLRVYPYWTLELIRFPPGGLFIVLRCDELNIRCGDDWQFISKLCGVFKFWPERVGSKQLPQKRSAGYSLACFVRLYCALNWVLGALHRARVEGITQLSSLRWMVCVLQWVQCFHGSYLLNCRIERHES